MQVRFAKSSPFAVEPIKATDGAAGYDLTALTMDIVTDMYIEYDTGIAMEIPEGYVGLLFPRSSVSKKQLIMANSVGVIDSDYRGTIKVRFKYSPGIGEEERYVVGDRVAQIVIIPHPKITFTEARLSSETKRGDGGFGSTGE